MKTLKFRENLSKLILKGDKDTTWRLFDDKDLTEGDEVSFVVKETLKEFAKAKIIGMRETTFGELTEEDWDGHEKFESEEEMYKIYSGYYNKEVNKNSLVKIIKFKLI
ncbi:ASCH domain-containing protein [Patescibacteria group bacterium]|nr:ASCH domain-containing protein [Patescibacteria group bacterium]MCG2694765.1 ASCH domain-containing protein [Candidatus Parcubacteria bacterium]